MLEGQVAVLSCNVPSKDEKKNITAKLRKSDLFEEHQYSYMLYPNSKLPAFKNKNNISENEISGLEKLIEKTGNTILRQDKNGNYHFNPFFRNADTMKEYLAKLPAEKKANTAADLPRFPRRRRSTSPPPGASPAPRRRERSPAHTGKSRGR